MPVEELNAVKMGEEFLMLLDSGETTTSLWLQNPEVIAWVFIALLFFGIMIGFLFFIKTKFGKHLK